MAKVDGWKKRLIEMLAKAAERGGKVYPDTFSLSDGKGGFIEQKKIVALLDELVATGTVVKEKGQYGTVGYRAVSQ